MKLQGKITLVTGAGSGIGKAVAMKFAEEGSSVALADIDADSARTAAEEIVSRGGRAMAVTLDVTQEGAVDDAVARIQKTWGTIDILISNAGFQIVHPLTDFPFEDWKRLLSVHLNGAFLTTRACMRQMRAAKRPGSIIYMASVHSKDASPDKSAYITAKHGLIGLCKAVAREGAHDKIRANAVCPGLVMTPLVSRQLPQMAAAKGISEDAVLQGLLSDTADGQATSIEEVVQAVLMFASFEGMALTGQSLVVSHGRAMQ